MHNTSIGWDQLKIVLSIARLGNLSKAAHVLGVNQSTVSRQLRSLENQLGVSLFHRSKFTMNPTEQCTMLVMEAETMESAAARAFEQISHAKTNPSGLIRFVAMPWISGHVIASNLAEFCTQYPHIQIQSICDIRERFLNRGEVEIAMRFEMQPRANVVNIPVASVSYSIYAPTKSDPDKLTWLGFREDGMALSPEKWLRSVSADKTVSFWANDAGVLYQGVRNGLGKALLPDILAKNDPSLTRLSGAGPEIERTLHIQVLPDVQRLHRMAIFLEWLSDTLTRVFDEHVKDKPETAIYRVE